MNYLIKGEKKNVWSLLINFLRISDMSKLFHQRHQIRSERTKKYELLLISNLKWVKEHWNPVRCVCRVVFNLIRAFNGISCFLRINRVIKLIMMQSKLIKNSISRFIFLLLARLFVCLIFISRWNCLHQQ